MRHIHRALLTLCAFLLLSGGATAQERLLTIDDLYGEPQRRISFSGTPVGPVTWLADGAHYLTRRNGELMKFNAASGSAVPFVDAAKIEAAFASLSGFSAEAARRIARSSFEMNPSRTGALFNSANDLFFYDFASSRITRLTNTPETEVGESFSPDGRLVAYVKNFNLHVVDLAWST